MHVVPTVCPSSCIQKTKVCRMDRRAPHAPLALEASRKPMRHNPKRCVMSPMLRGSLHGLFPPLLSADCLHEKSPFALWACYNRGATLDGTFLCKEYGVLRSGGHRGSSLARGRRTHRLRPGRSRYGSWTQNRADDPAHASPTPHPLGVATLYHYCGRACPTGTNDPPPRGADADCYGCGDRRDQPPVCLQVGAAVCGGRSRRAGRQIGPWPPARAAHACAGRVARGGRVTRWGRSQRAWERGTKWGFSPRCKAIRKHLVAARAAVPPTLQGVCCLRV